MTTNGRSASGIIGGGENAKTLSSIITRSTRCVQGHPASTGIRRCMTTKDNSLLLRSRQGQPTCTHHTIHGGYPRQQEITENKMFIRSSAPCNLTAIRCSLETSTAISPAPASTWDPTRTSTSKNAPFYPIYRQGFVICDLGIGNSSLSTQGMIV